MIDHMNRTMQKHIVTIEDPIEFLHRDRNCIINQREVGQDTASFKRALRRVLRQDPDVILVGEMRDEETVHTALSAAETGHLVLSTLHTVDAPETVNRIIDFFPPHQQQQARAMIAGTLKGIVSQRLVKTADGQGRVACCEIMVMTGRVHDMILDPKLTGQLPEVVAEGGYYGMQTFDQHLLKHLQAGRITYEEAMRAATSPHDFKLMVAAVGPIADLPTQPSPRPSRSPRPARRCRRRSPRRRPRRRRRRLRRPASRTSRAVDSRRPVGRGAGRVVPTFHGPLRRIVTRTLKAFYDDQMTHHAAALTYYALMSLFPAVLLALSLLGLVGQYPQTYDALLDYLTDVVPASLVEPLDSSLRSAFQAKGTATTTLVISVGLALYGTTGVLEAARRALNVVFDVSNGRSFLRRKLVDVGSTIVLMALILVCLVLAFVGGGLAEDLLGYLGLGEGVSRLWNQLRWPAAVLVAMGVFSFIYYVTPDIRHRAFHWITPGAVVAVLLWLAASYGLSLYLSRVADVGGDLRRVREPDRAGRLALADQRRAAVRRRAQRRDRAPEGTGGGRAAARHAQPARASRVAGHRFNK